MQLTAIDSFRLNNPPSPPLSAEWMSREEWERRFPGEFVAMIDPECDEQMWPRAGFVIFHSRDRDEAYAEIIRLKPKHFACEFAGREPEDLEYLL